MPVTGVNQYDRESSWGEEGGIALYTVMDHSTNHPKFSHDTLIHTLRYLTGSYYITRYLVYYVGFVIPYKMQLWQQIRVSLEEVTVPT